MCSDDVVISLRNVTKRYRLFAHSGDRVKQFLSFGMNRYYREFTALQNVSLEVRRGETIGIIGPNGSGKSTLLQLICGILKPSSGTVTVKGRISALLELGSGFNPEFTGRENVYFQGVLMGFTKAQMDERFEHIAAFADIGEFIEQPVRTYSSGMFVRLAFAVAVSVDPDILVVDEALAVGDMPFQRKCFDKVYELQKQGTSIIVVSHNPYQIERLCHWAAVVNAGEVSRLHPAKETLTLYQELVHGKLEPGPGTHAQQREGTHELTFSSVSVEDQTGAPISVVETGQAISIVAEFVCAKPHREVRFRFEFCSAGNDVVTMVGTIGLTEEMCFDGTHKIRFYMPNCQLTSGWYYVNAIAVDRNLRLDTWQRASEFKVLLKDIAARNLSSDCGAFVCQGEWEIA